MGRSTRDRTVVTRSARAARHGEVALGRLAHEHMTENTVTGRIHDQSKHHRGRHDAPPLRDGRDTGAPAVITQAKPTTCQHGEASGGNIRSS